MRNKQVLLGFNRDPQKVQQYTCSSIEDKMEDATRGTSAGHGTNGHVADQINKLKSKALAWLPFSLSVHLRNKLDLNY